MSQDNDRNESRMQSLHAVLAEYIRRQDAGEAVDIESFCAAYPELADGLRSYAEGEGMLEALSDPAGVAPDNLRSAETLRPGAAQRTDFASQAEFGRYRLIRQLGNGAMGAVYLAEDTQLGRRVALKIPTCNGTEGPEFLKRFKREAQAAAQLEHQNLCRIYDFGDVNGTPFISMEYIDGPPLAACVGVAAYLDQRRIAEIIVGIATGLQCAHERGILHRDVKSSNVLMKNGESPCVSDFGLALIDGHQESKLTHEGSILGTPAYMAPEQIQSDRGRIGPHSDVYALGVVLYEMLAGHTPFQGGPLVMLNQALNDRPQPLQKVRADVDPKLADYCLRMLEKDPERRPKSMQEVIDYLDRWLQQTSPDSLTQQAKSEQERSRYEAMKSKVLGLVQRGQHPQAIAALEKMQKLTGTVGEEYAEWARTKIPDVKKLPQQLRKAVPDLVNTSRQCIRKYDYAQAALLLQDIPPDFRTPEAQQTLDKALELQEESDLLLLALKDCVRTRDLNGIEENLKRFLALKPGNRFAKELWESLQTYSKLPYNQRNYKFDKKGNLQPRVSGSFWDNWLLVGTLCFAFVFGVAYSGIMIYLKDGSRTLAVEVNDDWLREQGGSISLDVDGKEHLITAGDTQVKVTFGEHGFSVRQGSTVVHDPQTFSIEKGDTQILHIDATGMRLVHQTDQLPLPDDDELISDGTSIVIDAPRTPLPDGPPGLVMELNGHSKNIVDVACSPNGNLACSIAADKTLRAWDLTTSKESWSLNLDARPNSLTFDPRGEHLLVATSQFARLIDAKTGVERFRLTQDPTPVFRAVWSADGSKLATGSNDGVRIWEFTGSSAPKLHRTIPIDFHTKTGPHGLAFAQSDTNLIVSESSVSSDDAEPFGIRLYDAETGELVRQYVDPVTGTIFEAGSDDITVCHDGSQVAVKVINVPGHSWDPVVLEIATGRIVRHPKTNGAPEFSPTGQFLAVGDEDEIVMTDSADRTVWNVQSKLHNLHRLAFTPDGRFLITGGGWYWNHELNKSEEDQDFPLSVWRLPKEVWPSQEPDARTTRAAQESPIPNGPPGLAMTLKGHTDEILAVVPSPDGRYLVSSGMDRTTKVWDIATGQITREIPLEPPAYRLRFDGDELVMGGPVGRLKQYRFADGQMALAYRGYPEDGREGSRSVGSIEPGHEPGTFVTCNFRGDVAIWKTGDAQPDAQFATEAVFQNAYPVPEGYLLSGFGTEQVRLVDVSGKAIREMYSMVSGGPIEVSPDKQVFLSIRDNKLVEVEISTGAELASYSTGWVNWRMFTSDGRYILCQDGDYNLQIWSRESGQDIYRAKLPIRAARKALSSDGRALFIAKTMFDSDKSEDRHEIYVWRLPKEVWPKLVSDSPVVAAISRTPIPDGPPGLVATLNGQADRTTALAVSPDGQLLASGDWSRNEYIWDLSRQQIVRKLEEPEGQIVTTHLRFVPGRHEILASGADGVVRKFDVNTGAKVLSYAGHNSKDGEVSNTVDSLHLLPDGQHFVTVSRNGTAANWNIDRADPLSYIELTQNSNHTLLGLPVSDGILLANDPSWGDPVKLHDSQTGRGLKTYDGISRGSIFADNAPNHFWHRSGANVRRISAKTGEVVLTLQAAESLADGVVTPDGRHFISGAGSPHFYMWDAATGVEVYRTETPCAPRKLAVSPDGRFLFFGSDDEKDATAEVHVWRLPQEARPR